MKKLYAAYQIPFQKSKDISLMYDFLLKSFSEENRLGFLGVDITDFDINSLAQSRYVKEFSCKDKTKISEKLREISLSIKKGELTTYAGLYVTSQLLNVNFYPLITKKELDKEIFLYESIEIKVNELLQEILNSKKRNNEEKSKKEYHEQFISLLNDYFKYEKEIERLSATLLKNVRNEMFSNILKYLKEHNTGFVFFSKYYLFDLDSFYSFVKYSEIELIDDFFK